LEVLQPLGFHTLEAKMEKNPCVCVDVPKGIPMIYHCSMEATWCARGPEEKLYLTVAKMFDQSPVFWFDVLDAPQ
jgi:hypothetical protein